MKLIKAIMAWFTVASCFTAALTAADNMVEENIRYQQERMEYLKNEYYVDYTPCDESKFTDFDLDEAIKNGVKYNELIFLGTHNSYQMSATPEYKELYNVLSDMTFGILDRELVEFEMDSLTEQLDLGIRNLEIDIETIDKKGDVSFIVTHNPLYDNTTSCYDFELALEEIKLWSDNNPGHLPLTIIIEPKKDVFPVNDMKQFSIKYAKMFDEILREKMGDKMITPADMMGEYSSLKEMRENDDWMTLEETMGKVIFLLHDTTVTTSYINQDKTIKTQAMFPMLRFVDINKSYASFIIDNNVGEALLHQGITVDKNNLIVRTRADFFPNFSEKEYEYIDNCTSQIISTDYPPRVGESKYHAYSFDGFTVKLQK